MTKEDRPRRRKSGSTTSRTRGGGNKDQQSLFENIEGADESLVPLQVIRTETVLSKMPLHVLSKEGRNKKNQEISITEVNERVIVTLRWEVSFNQKFGPPGQLAYKIDTLVVNKAIYEAGRPVPE